MPRAAGTIHPHTCCHFFCRHFRRHFRRSSFWSSLLQSAQPASLEARDSTAAQNSKRYRVLWVRQGDALYVPSFWHHAVYSPPGTLSEDCRNVGINYWYIAQHTREEAMEKMHSMEGKEDL